MAMASMVRARASLAASAATSDQVRWALQDPQERRTWSSSNLSLPVTLVCLKSIRLSLAVGTKGKGNTKKAVLECSEKVWKKQGESKG